MQNAMTIAHNIRIEAATKWACDVADILWDECLRLAWRIIKGEDKMQEQKQYSLRGASGYGCSGWTQGQIVKVKPERHDGHEYLYVETAKRQYVRHDGMSFGVGAERGYLYSATCRPATQEESAALRDLIEATETAKAKAETWRSIAKVFVAEGGAEEGHPPKGQVISAPDNDREWFVVADDKIWFCRNEYDWGVRRWWMFADDSLIADIKDAGANNA